MQGSDTQKKHCFTRGLIERLKLREVSNEGVDRKRFGSSSLPILIWESPLLAKLYKITFIARIESDGREGLGFRFDDTISESPRDIVWGGNVGTIDSPLCFLDGSQTFVTQSFSKASERCRRGWHVRIGKVSEIIRAFENSEESLVMKLSIRKLDSNTKPIRLDPQPPIIKPPQYSFNDFRYPPHYPLPKAPKLNTPSYQQRIPEPFSSKSLNCNYLSRSNSLLTPPTTPVLGMDDAQSASLAPAEKIEENEMSKADNVPEDESIPEEKPEPEGDLVAEDSPVPEENLVAEDSLVPEEDLVAEDSPVPKGEPIPEEEMSESPLRDDSQDQVDPSDEPEVANVVEASKPEDNEQLENFEDKEVENLCQPEEVSGDMTPEPVTVIEGSLKPQDSDGVVCLAFGGSNGTVGTRVLYVPLEIVKPIEYFRKQLENQDSRPNSLIDHLRASLIWSTRQVPDPLLDRLKTCKSQLEGYRDRLVENHPRGIEKTRKIFEESIPSLMRIGSGVLKLTIRSMFLITDLIFLESKFLVKKLFGSGKKDERDDELESGISEGYTKFKRFFETLNAGYLTWRQFRREAIEPILQIEEYDDDDDGDDERDDENHNQESSGSEVVATLKVPGSSYLLYCSVFDYLRHGSIKFKLPRSKESRYHRDLLRTIELNTDPDCGDEEEDCRVSKRSMSRFSIKFDDTSSPFNVSVEPHRNRILVLISSDGEKQENLRVCEARKVYQLSKKLGLEDLKRKMVMFV